MLTADLTAALDIVRSAVHISRAVQGELTLGGRDKEDRTPVTVADLGVQALISGYLAEHFPQDPLMGEESIEELQQAGWSDVLDQVVHQVGLVHPGKPAHSEVLRWIERGQQPIDMSRRYWVLDPIDGTKGFLRREQYAIALALVERGQILLGILACPNLPATLPDPTLPVDRSTAIGPGQIYAAVKGGGAQCYNLQPDGSLAAPQPVHVTTESDPALVRWCERVESSSRNKDYTSQIVEHAGITLPPHRLDSQTKYAVVARGETALYLRHTLDPNYREKVWDHAAGVLIMEEAGGQVTDLLGQPLNFGLGRQLDENRGIIATTPHLHSRIRAAVQHVLNF